MDRIHRREPHPRGKEVQVVRLQRVRCAVQYPENSRRINIPNVRLFLIFQTTSVSSSSRAVTSLRASLSKHPIRLLPGSGSP